MAARRTRQFPDPVILSARKDLLRGAAKNPFPRPPVPSRPGSVSRGRAAGGRPYNGSGHKGRV